MCTLAEKRLDVCYEEEGKRCRFRQPGHVLRVAVADLFSEHQFVDFANGLIGEDLKGGYRCLSL
jgi:hypothetical protein